MCAAICAARSGAEVTIIEKNDSLGKKLSMTGNGRCNLTNLDMRQDCYNPASRGRMKKWLAAYDADDVRCFFKSLGVVTVSENGYIYPASGQARTVVDALENEIRRLGIEVIYKEQFKGISSETATGPMEVVTSGGKYTADACIIAVGSLSGPKSTLSTGDGYYICGKLGMNIKDTYPALVGFKCSSDEIMPSQGVRINAGISFTLGDEVLACERGEVQFTSEGISGIPVMQAAREVVKFVRDKKPVYAVVDLFPDYDDKAFDALKKEMLSLKNDRTISEFLVGFSNSNITDVILKRMKLSPGMKMKNVSDSMVECILDSYRSLKILLDSDQGYQASQVTTGGVSLGDISDDFSYVRDNRIFVIGEILDVDGRCGGSNLQFAFTSGSIAGRTSAI
jgi:predicted Rossmann fold flavoprotein